MIVLLCHPALLNAFSCLCKHKQPSALTGASNKGVRFNVAALTKKSPAPGTPVPPAQSADTDLRRKPSGSAMAVRKVPGTLVTGNEPLSPEFTNYDDMSPASSVRITKPALRRSLPNTDTDDLSQMELLNQEQILSTLRKRHSSAILQVQSLTQCCIRTTAASRYSD